MKEFKVKFKSDPVKLSSIKPDQFFALVDLPERCVGDEKISDVWVLCSTTGSAYINVCHFCTLSINLTRNRVYALDNGTKVRLVRMKSVSVFEVM